MSSIVHKSNLSFSLGTAISGLGVKDQFFTYWKHRFNVKGQRYPAFDESFFSCTGRIDKRRRFKKDRRIRYQFRVTREDGVTELIVHKRSDIQENLVAWFDNFDIRTQVLAILNRVGSYSPTVPVEDGGLFAPPLIDPAMESELLIDGSWRGDAAFFIANAVIYTTVWALPSIADRDVFQNPYGGFEDPRFSREVSMRFESKQPVPRYSGTPMPVPLKRETTA